MRNTPRDFFLHFGAFAALYAAATALGTLLFQIIDYAFPDPLYTNYYSYRYDDPYSGAMRFAIASLIILVPLFLYLMRVVQREARLMPERHTFAVRRWLTYVTLFVAGATIVGDLITLVYSFLGGDLPTPFLLKVLTLLVIVGVVFWYFLLDIRGHWQNHENTSKTVGGVTIVAVLAAIVGSFFIMGSPMVQRDMRFDQEQIDDLALIQNQVVNYWQQNNRLPQTLSELESAITGFAIPTAPEGRPAYEYRITGDLAFELCATFARESDNPVYNERLYVATIPGSVNWEHAAGRACFVRKIDTDLIQPHPKYPQVDQVIP